MRYLKVGIGSGVRPLMFTMILLAIASFTFFHGSVGLWHESASAQAAVVAVNAASFDGAADRALTPDTIAALFGIFVTQNNQVFIADTLPLPTTLGGVSITIDGIASGIFFVSTTQINMLIPSNVTDGDKNITVTNSDGTTRVGVIKIERSSPGLFSARANGQGTAAALTTTDGVNFLNIANPDGSAREVSAGTVQQPNILVLFGTGIRNAVAANPNDANGVAEAVMVTIQGVMVTVLYAGPAPGFAGLDQINLIIPPELSGFGTLKIRIKIGTRMSNEVTILIGGSLPPVVITNIAFNQQVNGTLTVADQIQAGQGDTTYFFDAYTFNTTSANTFVAIDLRSVEFDAAVLLYRVENNALNLIGGDDQSGGYGNGSIENNNALMLAVLPNPGQYVFYATSADVEPNGIGNYTVRVLTGIGPQLSYGQNATNPSIVNTDLQTAAGTFLDVYWFNGVQGDNVRINMNSTAFDSFLVLQRNDGDPPITFDDNSGGGNNAQITRQLASSGIFIIIATPFAPNVTGAYTLSLNRVASFAPENPLSGLMRAQGRQITDNRVNARGLEGSTFERASNRRILLKP